MKVALLTAHLSQHSGGFANSVSGLAASLDDLGEVAATIVGVRDDRAPEAWREWGEKVVPCRQYGPRAFGWAPGLASSLEGLRPEVLDAQGVWMYPSLASLRYSDRRHVPRVVTPRGMLDPWALKRARPKKRVAWLWFERRHLTGAACLRALNAAEHRSLREFGLRNPIAIVPNGVELPALEPPRGERAERILLFLGRLDPKKRVQELVRAWALAGVARFGWRLRIVGWGHPGYVEATRDLVAELGVERSVDLPGPAFGQQKSRVLREADAFVLPSVSEGLPMAVLEAWSHALPVIMTPQCNLPEGFAAGAAIEIEPEPSSIAEGVRQLAQMSEDDRKRMGRAGRALVEQQFTWPRVARQMREVYAWVLGGGPPPSCVMTD